MVWLSRVWLWAFYMFVKTVVQVHLRECKTLPSSSRRVVLQDIPDTPTALAYLFGFLYALNISYPKALKYTFDTLQNVFMEICLKCTRRVQSLKNKLAL